MVVSFDTGDLGMVTMLAAMLWLLMPVRRRWLGGESGGKGPPWSSPVDGATAFVSACGLWLMWKGWIFVGVLMGVLLS